MFIIRLVVWRFLRYQREVKNMEEWEEEWEEEKEEWPEEEEEW